MVGTKLTLKTVGFVGSVGSVHNFPWDHDGIKNMKYPSPMEGDGTREREIERERERGIDNSFEDRSGAVGRMEPRARTSQMASGATRNHPTFVTKRATLIFPPWIHRGISNISRTVCTGRTCVQQILGDYRPHG